MRKGCDPGQSVEVLRSGGIVAYPTDTVYGLGADISSERAVNRIYDIKGREASKPFLLNIARPEQAYSLVKSVSYIEKELMEKFWPGPLTIIFEASSNVPEIVLRGHKTIGLRVPDHPLALQMLEIFNSPVISTSINHSGEPPLLSSDEVERDFGAYLDYLLGVSEVCQGLPSTIVRVVEDKIVIMRSGACDSKLLDVAKYHMWEIALP